MLTQVVAQSLDETPLTGKDDALAQLALTYAGAIENGGDLARLGPALMATLEALLMSPRARAAAKKAVTDAQPTVNPLDDLAAARARRGRAAGVDAGAAGS